MKTTNMYLRTTYRVAHVRAVTSHAYFKLNIFAKTAPLTVGVSPPTAYAQSLACKAVRLLGKTGKFYRSDEICKIHTDI